MGDETESLSSGSGNMLMSIAPCSHHAEEVIDDRQLTISNPNLTINLAYDDLPSHSNPFPRYPGKQEHVKLPKVFVQWANTSHGRYLHSLSSEKKELKCQKSVITKDLNAHKEGTRNQVFASIFICRPSLT